MDFLVLSERLKAAYQKRDAFFMLALLSLLVNVILSAALLLHRPNLRTLVVPANFKQSFWIDNDGASASYLTQMTRFFAMLYLNTTPATAQKQVDEILKYSAPEHYGKLKALLYQRMANLRKEEISTVFYPLSAQSSVKSLTATITGDLVYFVGGSQTSKKRLTYRAHYRHASGRLYLLGFKEEMANV